MGLSSPSSAHSDGHCRRGIALRRNSHERAVMVPDVPKATPSIRQPSPLVDEIKEAFAGSASNNLDEIVAMYAMVNRIRLFASDSVLEAAETFVKKLAEKFGENNMSLDEIKAVALEQHVDRLNDFALKCRLEFRKVYARVNWGGT